MANHGRVGFLIRLIVFHNIVVVGLDAKGLIGTSSRLQAVTPITTACKASSMLSSSLTKMLAHRRRGKE